MHILYIHQYFRKPEQGGALRSYYLSKALVEAGHTVELITASNGPKYYQENVAGIQVHYLPVAYDNSFGFLKRIGAFLSFTFRSIKLAFSLKNIQLCYATSTPLTVGLVAIALKKFRQIPFYFEVRDLWPEAPIQLGYIRNIWVQHLLYIFEHYIYRQADKVIALSPGILEGIKSYKSSQEIFLLPNMADCEYYTPVTPTRNSFNEPFNICYIGTLGRANRVAFLLEAAYACQLNGLTQVKFMIAGTGAETAALQKLATDLKLENITWVGHLNRDQVRQYLALAHATYTSFDTKPILQTNSPNKFFDSLAAGKLTIVNTTGWLQHLVEEHYCGFYADPTKPQDFVEKLMPYLQNPDLLLEAQQNARRLAVEKFSRGKIAQEYIQLFPKVN
ncbi:glycosyltransferase family 4 protein [Adhaeribacter rhizoryzae]|uniref:Glycosyltransferase family 4 protein n=1 Tax=Adhaeribacter rhizoryzae TaxID=2607907 RepID=A0A5M6DC39_9BACT|nr:glycosyltransferase family 4 protein [Adhaeribacter rhizoryzae]KAA5544036.1 glycosyltransferase family 4 protein [Adhaeribacter rhizoryzae]